MAINKLPRLRHFYPERRWHPFKLPFRGPAVSELLFGILRRRIRLTAFRLLPEKGEKPVLARWIDRRIFAAYP